MSHRTPVYIGLIDASRLLEGEQFAGAGYSLGLALAFHVVEPACGKLACRPRRADRRAANVTNRFDAFWADSANNVIDMCHRLTMQRNLTFRKTNLFRCAKFLVRG